MADESHGTPNSRPYTEIRVGAARAIFLLLLGAGLVSAQVCRLSVAGLNRNRQVLGPVNVECPGGVHSAPFGNWGVTSNFGQSLDGHQFDGWCHDSEVVFNDGQARTACGSDWYQWNSCTSHPDFSSPNCTLFNSDECTTQKTTTGVNVLGTVSVEVPVGCPLDLSGDGTADAGGCADVQAYAHSRNFMSLYELDPLTGNSLVQTLFFPETPVALACDIAGCEPNGSPWVEPESYDDPVDRVVATAEFAMAVNGGVFDSQGRCNGAPLTPVHAVSAAAYRGEGLAADSLASLFGVQIASRDQLAVNLPLPLQLAGRRVQVTDSQSVRREAKLLFVSPSQINFLVPADVAEGTARIDVVDGFRIPLASGRTQIRRVAPALFSADASGSGVAAALWVETDERGRQTVAPAFACESGRCVERRLRSSAGAALVLFGSGIRGRAELSAVRVLFGSRPGRVLYAGDQSQFEGLDQINVEPPPDLAGAVDVVVQIDGLTSNAVRVMFE